MARIGIRTEASDAFKLSGLLSGMPTGDDVSDMFFENPKR